MMDMKQNILIAVACVWIIAMVVFDLRQYSETKELAFELGRAIAMKCSALTAAKPTP